MVRLARFAINGESLCMRLALLCLLVACGGAQIQERKAADLAKLGPASLYASQPKEGEPRDAKIRVWADAGVRALPGWKDEINDQIDYASQLLTPLLGVRLKIEDVKDWDRTGDPTSALKDLEAVDEGKEVIWVVGYVTAGDSASKAMTELGSAELLGKHIIVRGWAKDAETEALNPTLPDVAPQNRNEVLAAHKRHKQTVVLLHMIARSLGAILEGDPAWIANPEYSPKQNAFADRTREILQTMIDRRLSDEPMAAIAKELLEKVSKEDWGGWLPGDRDAITQQLTAKITADRQGEAASDVPMAALEQFERIKVLARKGDTANAMAELENLIVAYPANATIYLLKCQLLLVKPGVGDKTARDACARVSELAPGDPSPHIAIAEAFVKQKDIKSARAELQVAAGKIEGLKTGATDQWKKLIGFYTSLGSLTWTEEVLVKAKLENDPMAAQIASTRARYGVPRGAKFVRPEEESALVGAVREALSLVYANKHAEAEKALASGEKKWPGAPGFAAVRCDLALRKIQLDAARAACAKAIAADPNQSWALYLSGVIALKDTSAGGTKTGIEKLKKAIAADPDLGQAWRTLAKAYSRAKDKPALEQLGKDYVAKFGQPLPP
jgi:tetratricopeptide (TPR) repeat protein